MKEPISALEKLPSHVMRQVLDEVTLTDVIAITWTGGEKLLDIIEDARVPITYFKLKFDTSKPSITFGNEKSEGIWNLYVADEVQLGGEKCRIGRYIIPVTKTANAIYGEHHDVELSMHMVLNHLLRIFHCTKTIIEKVVVDLAAIEDPGVVLGKLSNFRQVKNLEVLNSNNDDVSAFHPNTRFWSQLPRILTVLQGIEHVDIQVPDSPSTPIPELMAIDSVVLDGVNWLIRGVIGEFKTAKLNNIMLTDSDMVGALKKYLESPNTRVKLLEIQTSVHGTAVVRSVFDTFPDGSYQLYQREPTSIDDPELTLLTHREFRPQDNYLRVIRSDGKAINVYFDPNLVTIVESTPESNRWPLPSKDEDWGFQLNNEPTPVIVID